MLYEGEFLNSCPLNIDFTLTQAVVVSGAKWNPCGHLILCTGYNSANCWYFHVAGQGLKEFGGFYAVPKFMREHDYKRYLFENGKHEIRRMDVKIQHPSGAYQKLFSLMINKWFWRGLWHNCATFVEEIVVSGGGTLSVGLNCPDQEVVQKLSSEIRDVLNRQAEFYLNNSGPKW